MAEIPLLQDIHYHEHRYSIHGCDQYTGVMQYTHATWRLLLPLYVKVAMLEPAKYCGEYLLPRCFRVLIDWIASAPKFHLIDYSLIISVSSVTMGSTSDMK